MMQKFGFARNQHMVYSDVSNVKDRFDFVKSKNCHKLLSLTHWAPECKKSNSSHVVSKNAQESFTTHFCIIP